MQVDQQNKNVPNWSSYKRKQVNIDKAQYNPTINLQLSQHYNQLHSCLVTKEGDDDIFNDTFLKLTHSYNPEQDFIEQFKHTFYNLRLAYEKDDRVANYYLSFIGDSVSTVNEPSECMQEIDKDNVTSDKLAELKKRVQSYAISQKSNNRADKKL